MREVLKEEFKKQLTREISYLKRETTNLEAKLVTVRNSLAKKEAAIGSQSQELSDKVDKLVDILATHGITLTSLDGSYWSIQCSGTLGGRKVHVRARAVVRGIKASVRYDDTWGTIMSITVYKTVKVHDYRLDHAVKPK